MKFEDYVNQFNLNCYLDSEAMYAAEQVWNHQQAKIDAMKKQLIDMQRKLNSVSLDEIRPRHSEYDYGWRDCSKTILDDLKEILK